MENRRIHNRSRADADALRLQIAVLPWAELEARIAPHYPKAGKGRHPVGLSVMLRIYFLQHWFALSDPGAEDALYESPASTRLAVYWLEPKPVED